LALAVFAAGLWAGGLGRRPSFRGAASEYPNLVRIAHSRDGNPTYGGIEIRDRTTINFLDTLFPNYRGKVGKYHPTTPAGKHYVLEFMLEQSGHSKRLVVWTEEDGEYWSGGSNREPVQGSFRRLWDWLPVRRALELATVPQGEKPWNELYSSDQRDEFFGVVLENARRQLGHIRFWAIRDLWILVELTAPRTQHRRAGHPTFHIIGGHVKGPFPPDHPRIREIRSVALDSLEGDTFRDATEILAYTADDAVLDELAARLRSAADWRTAGSLIVCLQACAGLPAFDPGAICGNSTAKEVRKFEQQEKQRTEEARAELLDWHVKWKRLPPEARPAAVLDAWRAELVRIPGEYEGMHFSEQLRRFRNLLRRGTALLTAVEAAQTESADLTLSGQLEFLKAFWTGRCDSQIVTQLLNGTRHQQMIACDVIAAAVDVSWKRELAGLLRTQRTDSANPRLWVYLNEKAAETLVICHEADAIPLLKEMQHHGFDTVRYAIQHFEVPQGRW
jgi:hypothetical protein